MAKIGLREALVSDNPSRIASRSRRKSGGGWWSRWVTLPHGPACKAGALLVCHDPDPSARAVAVRGHLIATRRREVNTIRSFASRFTPSRCSSEEWHAALVLPQARWVLEARLRKLAHGVSKVERPPGIAPGSSPWHGDILPLNHSRLKNCGPGTPNCAPGP